MAIAGDNQLVAFLRKALLGKWSPEKADQANPVWKEILATLRIYFYCCESFCVLPEVNAELERHPEGERRESLLGVRSNLLPEYQWPSSARPSQARVDELTALHPDGDASDARIVAEAEFAVDIDTLLCFDKDVVTYLGPAAKRVRAVWPSIYWRELGIAPGSRTIREPAPSSPLYGATWWLWTNEAEERGE